MTLFVDGVAAITGAASGIGRATASAIANDGCTRLVFGDVSIVGIEETRRLVLEKHPEAQIRLRELDISDEASVERFYGAAVEHFGPTFDKQYAVNQKRAFLCERSILRHILKQDPRPSVGLQGSIVVGTSQLTQMTCNRMTAYMASKAGARGLCRSDALDYAAGPTETALLLESQDDVYICRMERGTPLRRNARPEDIANGVFWLSSDRASFMTGVSLIVDGGMGLEVGSD